MIEYDAPHRTQTQILADDLQQAMRNLRRDWPHMIRPGDTQSPGWRMKTAATRRTRRHPRRLRPAPVPPRPVTRSWAEGRIRRRRPATHRPHHLAPRPRHRHARLVGAAHRRRPPRPQGVPDGLDPLGLAQFIERHADWVSGHEAAQECRDELVDIAHRCHLVAFPTKRESFSIGRCPIEIPGEQDVLEVCNGDVRSRPFTDGERDGQAWCACNRCGQVAVASWWEDRMFDDPETQRWLTDAGVVTLIHRLYGEVVAQSTIRGWVRNKVLQPSTEKTEDGRRLFDRDAVVYAIDLHKRRTTAENDTPGRID